ncbi:MAG: Rossmann-like domain-containing protein [Thermoproteus sp.]
MASRRPLVRLFAERAAGMAEGLKIADYCLCLRGGYVVVEGPRGRALGFAHIPHEDLHELGEVRRPRLEEMPEFVVDLNPLNRVLGVAMLNAVSQYHLDSPPGSLDLYLRDEPICLVGNIGPLAERLRREGREVLVFERSRELRWRAYSDVEEELLLPRCKVLVITGVTLLNFTLDRVLELSNGLNILTGSTAGIHPELARGTKIHILASMKLDIGKTVDHLKQGGYISLAIRKDLGFPYAIDLRATS